MIICLYEKKIDDKNYEVFSLKKDDNNFLFYLMVNNSPEINCMSPDKEIFINQLLNSGLEKKLVDDIIKKVKEEK